MANPRLPGAAGGTFGTGVGGYSPAYGGIPQLPTGGDLAGNLQSIISQAIPGFSGLTKSATGVIGSALSGELPGDVQSVIRNQAATQAAMSGMPGSNTRSGSLYGNRTLKDLGITSLQRQDQGVKDLLGLLQGYSGTVFPTFGQNQEQANAISQYSAAPNPAAAAAEEERLFNKYSNPAGGFGGAVNGGLPWYQQGKNSRSTTSYIPGRPGIGGGAA